MQVVTTVLIALQMLSAIVMIGLILVQHGKGADMGAAFGSGSSGSLFGASGSANFMSHATAWLAGTFFVCTLALAYFSGVRPMNSGSGSVLEKAGISAPAGAASGSAPIPTGASTPALPAAATGAAVPAAAGSAASAATGSAPIPTK
jgi:preprotein translocase subunit SecG